MTISAAACSAATARSAASRAVGRHHRTGQFDRHAQCRRQCRPGGRLDLSGRTDLDRPVRSPAGDGHGDDRRRRGARRGQDGCRALCPGHAVHRAASRWRRHRHLHAQRDRPDLPRPYSPITTRRMSISMWCRQSPSPRSARHPTRSPPAAAPRAWAAAVHSMTPSWCCRRWQPPKPPSTSCRARSMPRPRACCSRTAASSATPPPIASMPPSAMPVQQRCRSWPMAMADRRWSPPTPTVLPSGARPSVPGAIPTATATPPPSIARPAACWPAPTRWSASWRVGLLGGYSHSSFDVDDRNSVRRQRQLPSRPLWRHQLGRHRLPHRCRLQLEQHLDQALRRLQRFCRCTVGRLRCRHRAGVRRTRLQDRCRTSSPSSPSPISPMSM